MPQTTVVRKLATGVHTGTMAVRVEGGPLVSMISTPPVIEGTPGTWTVSETDRPGRQPITQATAPGLRGMRMEHVIASPNPNVSIEHLLHPFRGIAESGKRVEFLGGGWLAEGTKWFVKALTIREDLKTHLHQTSRATLNWECVEANTVNAVELSTTGVKLGRVLKPGQVIADPKKPHLPGWNG